MVNHTEELNISGEIEQLSGEDKGDRIKFAKKEITGLEIYERDKKRLEKAKEILSGENVIDQLNKDELNMLAYVFMHSDTVDDYKKAFELTTKAVEMGLDPKTSLIPQATDRLMIQEQVDKGIGLLELKQKYGTQTRYDKLGQPFKLPLDSTVTREEFEKFGIEQL